MDGFKTRRVFRSGQHSNEQYHHLRATQRAGTSISVGNVTSGARRHRLRTRFSSKDMALNYWLVLAVRFGLSNDLRTMAYRKKTSNILKTNLSPDNKAADLRIGFFSVFTHLLLPVSLLSLIVMLVFSCASSNARFRVMTTLVDLKKQKGVGQQ